MEQWNNGTMNKGLPSTIFRSRKNSAGFTLIELLLVITVVIVITALTIPVGIHFYQTQVLNETMDGILGVLRRSHNQAVFQKDDSAFGVKFLSDSYVLFRGESYVARVQNDDETFILPTGVGVSGIDEVVFTKLTGLPSATGTLTIISGNSSQMLNINSYGKIERN